MSFYATIQGEIRYEKNEDFVIARDFLRNNGYVIENNMIDYVNKTIYIPYGYYKNLSEYIVALFKGGVGRVIYTSSDGVLEGWVVIDGKEENYDLKKWAEETLEKKEIPDPDKDFDAFCEWESRIEEDFHNYYE
jgi:hypothetical protein